MLGLLRKIAAGIGGMALSGTAGTIAAYTIVATAIGATILWVLGQLPTMPAVPPPPTGIKWLNWFVPVGELVAIATGYLTMYVAWLGIRIVGRWVRAI